MDLSVMHLYIIKNEDTMMKCAVDWSVNFTLYSHVAGTFLL